jgi:hypothetical protein
VDEIFTETSRDEHTETPSEGNVHECAPAQSDFNIEERNVDHGSHLGAKTHAAIELEDTYMPQPLEGWNSFILLKLGLIAVLTLLSLYDYFSKRYVY